MVATDFMNPSICYVRQCASYQAKRHYSAGAACDSNPCVCQGELSPELCALDRPEAASPVLRLW